MSGHEKKAFGQWLPGSMTSLAGITLAITAMATGLSLPVLAELPEAIAQRIETLKNSQQRWLEVDLSDQQLTAWQGNTTSQTITVSTGKPSTPTPIRVFTIQRKLPQDRMRGADYDVPNVPSVMYYHRGYAIHGAYWHNQFGTPVSHGCINVPVEAAQQLFQRTSVGTPVVIHQ
ncbi:MAG: L,D-transpeptidase [Cyanophyceae cyanobacterium]